MSHDLRNGSEHSPQTCNNDMNEPSESEPCAHFSDYESGLDLVPRQDPSQKTEKIHLRETTDEVTKGSDTPFMPLASQKNNNGAGAEGEVEHFLRRARSLNTRATPIPTLQHSLASSVRPGGTSGEPELVPHRMRRSSHDELHSQRCFLIEVDETEKLILEQEDTDGDFQITVKDLGPKSMKLGSVASHGVHKYDIRGTYVLSNLLQELALAKEVGRQQIILHESKLTENPVTRLSRMIANHFWSGLTRTIDRKGLQIICQDPKNRSKDQSFKIYVPYEDAIAKAYFLKVMENTSWDLQVHILPPDITPEYVKTLDQHPGILSLALRKVEDPLTQAETWRGLPFVVPGGRFNEMYGWDSYFEALGLLIDGQIDLAKSMVDNFCYEIHHYGKILNANRTYYLTRSQPPFLTDMALSVYQAIGDREWLSRVLLFAIKEYYTVWTSAPRFDLETGLSFYHTTGVGMPPETESTHFSHILAPYAAKNNVSIHEFTQLYNVGAVKEPELDQYFVHDRAVRESGHDTTYRFERKCADLLTVDLNSLLYKYEKDIAFMIELLHADVGSETARFPICDSWTKQTLLADIDMNSVEGIDVSLLPEHLRVVNYEKTSVPVPFRQDSVCHWEAAEIWLARAERRRLKMNELLWMENMFYDYDACLKRTTTYESATTFWTLWAGLATPEQAESLVQHALPRLEMLGGIVSGTEESRGPISLDRPNRQWDYPFGWAPHQIMVWRGFAQYGYHHIAQRLAYRWLYTITKAFVDFNGVVPEKFDVVTLNHILKVEYGNVGTDFKYVPREGFGWMNASYQIGLTYLTAGVKRQLGVVSPPDVIFQTSAAKSASRSFAIAAEASSLEATISKNTETSVLSS